METGNGKNQMPRARKPLNLPTMPTKCKTCPFRDENKCTGVAESVTKRVLSSGSQICHSTGWPKGTHLCRGARDVQLDVMHKLGVIESPTDAAWEAKRKELGC